VSALGVVAGGAFTVWAMGCTALLNIDRFSVAPQSSNDGGEAGTAQAEYTGLIFTLVDMFPHKNHYFEYRVVDSQNVILARGAVEPVGLGTLSNSGVDTPITAPRLVPNANATDGPFRLDFFAETSTNNRKFVECEPDASPDSSLSCNIAVKDHSWRVGPPLIDTLLNGPLPDGSTVPPHVDGFVDVYFVHYGLFTDIDLVPGTQRSDPPIGEGNDITFTLSNLEKYAGDLLELRVYEASTTRNVGLYRFPSLGPTLEGGADGASLTRTIAGVIDSSSQYTVDVYIDANGNGIYDNPATGGGDLGWRFTETSSAGAFLTIKFDPTRQPSNVDVGPP
jgi:hypothetical protein